MFLATICPVVRATGAAITDSILLWFGTTLLTYGFDSGTVRYPICSIFRRVPTFPSSTSSLFTSVAHPLASALSSLTPVSAVRENLSCIWMIFYNVDLGMSSDGIRAELQRFDRWSKHIVKYWEMCILSRRSSGLILIQEPKVMQQLGRSCESAKNKPKKWLST